MKIAVVSSAAVPAPPPPSAYGGLEAITGNFAIEAAKLGHEVSLITTEGSGVRFMPDLKVNKLTVMETIKPSWDGDAETIHYQEYRSYLENNFGDGSGIVWDNTWLGFPYISMKKFPNMKIIHTHHGMLGFPNPPPVHYPNWCGLSKAHAALMASQMKIPVRYVYNGIYMPSPEDQMDIHDDGYLLSLNRISAEKGIHHIIDIAVQTGKKVIIAGDDTKVADQRYVAQIIRRCRESRGFAEYYGLIDASTKKRLLQGCSAVIACPELSWMEGFGLFAVEALSYGKAVLAVANGGLAEIVETGKSGFLASTPGHLIDAIPKIPEIKATDCIARANEFTVARMVDRYLQLFTSVLQGSQRW